MKRGLIISFVLLLSCSMLMGAINNQIGTIEFPINPSYDMKNRYLALLTSTTLLCSACSTQEMTDESVSLKEALEGKFLIGATMGGAMFEDLQHPNYEIISKHFNSISPENVMKWEPMNPEPGRFILEPIDHFVEYGHENDLAFVGHTLFWHSQTPDWIFEDDEGNQLTREALLQRMRERAQFMTERWGDRIEYWDVVNESILGDGSWRESKFTQIIGDDFTEQAFRIASEVLPAEAKLLYNDYSMTSKGRRDAVVAMVKDFKAKGIRIDGIGIQGHWTMDFPSLDLIDTTLTELAAAGLPLHVTELDIDFLGRDGMTGANVDIEKMEANSTNNPYPEGILPAAEQAKFTARYTECFKVLLKHSDNIERVTFWGVTDNGTWLNNWPLEGRTNYGLLFDRNYEPKPAFFSIIKAAQEH